MNLEGVRILDLTQLLPGPYGSQLLADAGAEVIKIEPPTGDPARLLDGSDGWAGHVFSAVNAGKKSVCLDLKHEQGKSVFYDLVREADVVFEQFRPGVVERLDVDYETLTEYNDELVYCSLTGYGQDGPSRERAGHDLNYVATAGLLDMTRESEDDPPTQPGYPIADMTGGLLAAKSIVAAVLSRELGNTSGEYLDIAMADAVLSYAQVETAMSDAGYPARPGGTPIASGYPWYGVYETADDRYVTLAALEPRFWEVFCEAVDRPDLLEYHMTEDPSRRAWLREELADVFAEQTRDEWTHQLGEIPDSTVAPVNTPGEALENSQFTQRNLFVETDAGHRRVRNPATAGGTAESETSDPPAEVPSLGEHTDDVLADCGYDECERVQLREADVI